MKRPLATLLCLVSCLLGAREPADPARPDLGGEPAPRAPDAQELATVPVAEAPLAPASDGDPTQLDEVVVTAQKTRQPLRKVPISVTAIGGDFIQDVGAADLADVSLYVPNVRVDADDLGSPQIFIRGFGTNAFNPSFEGSVAFVQDELYFGRPGYFTESMFDIDRVEVLRGPQGTLFGKNSVAGVFNVVSRGPEDDFGGDARYFFGEANEHRFEGGVGGMGETFGARLAVLYRKQDGELKNQFLDRGEEELEQQAARVKLRLATLWGLDSELTAAVSDTEAPFWPFQLMRLDADTRDYLEGFDPDIEDDPRNFVTSFDTRGFIEKGSDTVGLKTAWHVGDFGALHNFESVLVVGASKFYIDQLNEIDVSPADIARLDSHEDHDQVSGELRFSGSGDSLFGIGTGVEFLAGAFWFDSGYTLLARVLAGRDLPSYLLTDDFAQLATEDNTAASPASPLAGLPGGMLGPVTAPVTDGDHYRFDYVQDIESSAFFGQLTWNLTEQWALTTGVRVNREKKRIDSAGKSHCAAKDAGAPSPCAMEQLLSTQDYDHRDLTRSESDVSPKFALQYFAPHGVAYYASWARGYKSGGFNSISFTGEDLEYEPEEARTTELGAKGRFFEGQLSVNLAAYETRFDNLQVLAFNGVFFDVSNAASAESRGLEADFQWITPWPALRLMGSAGVLDATYLAYDSAPAPVGQGINQTQDLAGERIAFAPKVTATLTPTLTFFIGDYAAQFAVDVLHQGDQFTDTDLDPATHVPAYTKYSGRLSLAPAAGGWSVALGGVNLTDERVLNQVTDAPFFPGSYFAQQAGGRQLFAVVSAQF